MESNKQTNIDKLTTREADALETLVISGNTKVAAIALNISPRTLECHIENIKTKLGVRYKHQLNAIFFQNYIRKT